MRGSRRLNILNYVKGEDLTVEDTTLQETYETYILSTLGGDPFLIKKTNFCNRVRLTRSEWIAGFQEIRLEKMLGDSEFDLFLDNLGEQTVEICIEDFNPELPSTTG